MTLGEIIKSYRKEHRMSMDAFAKASSLSKAYISMLEKNLNPKTGKPITPSLQCLQQVADGMKIEYRVLIDMMNDNNNAETESNNPVERKPCIKNTGTSQDRADLLSKYDMLNVSGKIKLHERANELLELGYIIKCEDPELERQRELEKEAEDESAAFNAS